MYPGKTLPQLEITFRHPPVHEQIQSAGQSFFAQLSHEELENYIFNKRRLELQLRLAPKDVHFEGKAVKEILEALKASIAQMLKPLSNDSLQETPSFNKDVFQAAIQQSAPSFSAATLTGYVAGTASAQQQQAAATQTLQAMTGSDISRKTASL